MIVEFSVLDTEMYSLEHLGDSSENAMLIEHYGKMGFSRLPPKQERFVQHHVKPKYDEDCIFMYQVL